MGTSLTRITATGTVAVRAELGAVVLTAGSAAATLTLRSGGASGTVLLTLKAPAETSVPVRFGGPDGGPDIIDLHATLAGTGAEASLEV